MRFASLSFSLCVLGLLGESQAQNALRFERIVIDDDFPGGYQVEVADINGDGKPDIIALGGGVCAWYENPTWTKRIVTGPDQTAGIISSASADLDGDGKAEIAIAYDFAMREPKRGKLGLAIQGETMDDPWTFQHIADVPSIHRVRWGHFDGDNVPDLAVAPIFGPMSEAPDFNQDVAKIRVFRSGPYRTDDQWFGEVVAERPVIHAIAILDLGELDRGFSQILSADNLGVSLFRVNPMFRRTWTEQKLVEGSQGDPPARGASEIHLGRFADQKRFLATIEPWHGSEVVVYSGSTEDPLAFSPRTVLDDTLNDGHALWVADIDGDGTDEVFAGHRGEDYRVSMYKFDGETWQRTVLDTEIAAQDLRGGDLDGNGVPDVVAIGGKTHNVVWYRPILD